MILNIVICFFHLVVFLQMKNDRPFIHMGGDIGKLLIFSNSVS